jgi:hypothetical protein
VIVLAMMLVVYGLKVTARKVTCLIPSSFRNYSAIPRGNPDLP